MEIREFAERVLFSTELESKLAPPDGELTDRQSGSGEAAAGTPATPGRPETLRLKENSERSARPRVHELEDDYQRGVLLHFFANHELLATELMALVLLKFPDAPAEFRRGVAETLQEEQWHTRWYLQRMKQCGVQFGDHPVNGFFWKAVSSMETPLDYVSRLSLTFEQANLDYARHYAEIFRQAGDPKSARILDRIYRDEIGHVGYGLKWFRKWKAPGRSDWQAFDRALPFPLSPSRAKGNGTWFNETGRTEAGLDPAFIRQLRLFSRSKGRTPNVYWFNPSAEEEIAAELGGGKHHATKAVAGLTRDLEILPAFLALQDDVVLVAERPSDAHLERLQSCGLPIPEFDELGSLTKQRKLRSLRPWGWSPAALERFEPLFANLPQDSAPAPEVIRGWWALSSKADQARRFCSDAAVCESENECLKAIRRLLKAGQLRAVAKLPWGASGRGHRWIETGDLEDADRAERLTGWVRNAIRRQGAVVVEPAFERVFDFSVQFERRRDGELRRLGLVRLVNDARGSFRSCLAGPKFCQGLPQELARHLMTEALPAYEEESDLVIELNRFLSEKGYLGPVGVDSFIYRDKAGNLAHRAVVEINSRYTMGRLTLKLARRVAQGHWVKFEIVRALESPVLPPGFSPPLCDAEGKLCSGTIPLNDPDKATHVIALLSVAKKAEVLLSQR